MSTTDKEILEQIKKAVLAVDETAELVLFGSRARGDFKEDSDWDVLVLSQLTVDGKLKRKISDQLFYVGLNNEATIATVVLNKENWYNKFNKYPLFYEVNKDGVAL